MVSLMVVVAIDRRHRLHWFQLRPRLDRQALIAMTNQNNRLLSGTQTGLTRHRGLMLLGTCLYSAALLWGMHAPRLPLSLETNVISHADKPIHFFAFMVLAFLITLTATLWKQATAGKIAFMCCLLLGIAALSEATQPLTGRQADVWDWLFDAAGIMTGSILVGCLRRIGL